MKIHKGKSKHKARRQRRILEIQKRKEETDDGDTSLDKFDRDHMVHDNDCDLQRE